MSAAASALEQHRRDFPALAGKVYANFGVVGTMARSALQAVAQHHEEKQQKGPASGPLFLAQLDEDARLRAALGALLQVPPESLALLDSTCTGCTAALLAVQWRAGDQLVLTDAEYPPLVHLSSLLARRFGIEVVTVPLLCAARHAEERIGGALGPRTRALLISDVLWTSGERLPIAALAALVRARAPQALLFVDGAQGPGNLVVRPAAEGADAYAFPGHKALCGPEGVGALYVSARALDELQPLTAGWRGVQLDARGGPAGFAKGARRFEMATTSFAAHRGLLEALRMADSFAAPEERSARVLALAGRAFHALREAGAQTLLQQPGGTSLVCFRTERAAPSQVVEALLRRRIFVRHLQQTAVVRLSLSYLNTEDEVDAMAAAVGELRQAGGL